MAQKKILIIDEDEQASSSLKKILKNGGYELFVASTVQKAESILEENRPDICIIDINLPASGVNGLSLLKQIKDKDMITRCIVVTSIDDKANRQTAKAIGADAYFIKPADTVVLIDTIKIAIHAQEKLREGGV